MRMVSWSTARACHQAVAEGATRRTLRVTRSRRTRPPRCGRPGESGPNLMQKFSERVTQRSQASIRFIATSSGQAPRSTAAAGASGTSEPCPRGCSVVHRSRVALIGLCVLIGERIGGEWRVAKSCLRDSARLWARARKGAGKRLVTVDEGAGRRAVGGREGLCGPSSAIGCSVVYATGHWAHPDDSTRGFEAGRLHFASCGGAVGCWARSPRGTRRLVEDNRRGTHPQERPRQAQIVREKREPLNNARALMPASRWGRPGEPGLALITPRAVDSAPPLDTDDCAGTGRRGTTP